MKKYYILLLIVFVCSCGRWKTTKLKSDKLCLLKPGSEPGEVTQIHDDDFVLDISFRIEAHYGNIYVIDNILKRIQVLEKNGDPIISIGAKQSKSKSKSSVKFSKFHFSIIGAMTVDSDGNIYAQNRFASSKTIARSKRYKKIGHSPSYILVFNDKGNLMYTLGKTGSPNIPFSNIEAIDIDKKNRLYVVSRSYDTWSISRYNKKKRDFSINFSENDFKDVEGEDTYAGKIEKIKSYNTGADILISVAYYHGADFKYRKIYNYSIDKRKIIRTIFIIPDPKNELFTLIDNKNIFLWDVEEKNIRFIICNFQGDVINNISIQFPERKEFYSDILIDTSGQFYSYHAIKKGIEIFEWR